MCSVGTWKCLLPAPHNSFFSCYTTNNYENEEVQSSRVPTTIFESITHDHGKREKISFMEDGKHVWDGFLSFTFSVKSLLNVTGPSSILKSLRQILETVFRRPGWNGEVNVLAEEGGRHSLKIKFQIQPTNPNCIDELFEAVRKLGDIPIEVIEDIKETAVLLSFESFKAE